MRRFALVSPVLVSSSLAVLLLVAGPSLAAPEPTVADRLAAAKEARQPVFLLVTEGRTNGVAAMRAAAEAARERAPHTVLVEMDRSQAVNRDLVKRYGLAGTRVPFVLVIAQNGAPGGGVMPDPKAEEKLLALLPSPRKADTLMALFERKAAFVVVGRATMPSRAAALDACRRAAADLKAKAVIVEVDLDDKAEATFLKVLGADAKATDVVVHVYGFSGSKTEALRGAVEAEALVKAATKKVECCPGGKCG